MKPIRHHLILILWLAATLIELALARPVSLVWDTPPTDQMVVGWRIYNGSTLLGASSVPSATVNIPNTATALTVTAINAKGESPPSAPLPIPAAMVMVQKSTDLQTWTNVVQIPYTESQFIRIQLPPP